ncbi:MAG: hypothetical protein J5679_00040 [Alphaproteobacteria bacterium]|nr:hypothetical protein [Alphaproteobacteria bacterium]
MKIRIFALLLCVVPYCVASAADRNDAARASVGRVSMSGLRNSTVMAAPRTDDSSDAGNVAGTAGANAGSVNVVESVVAAAPAATPENCRDAYRSCMDEFCLLSDGEGERCACSSNIQKSKSLIKEIQDIQAEADKLYTEGVEREKLGAKVSLVFGESESAQRASRASGLSFIDWLNSGEEESGELAEDNDIGAGLYEMASNYCADVLDSCGDKAEMEKILYSRQIVADCKTFDTYLTEQKANAESNKRTAEAAVRKARLEMLDTTNKYNRGECLLAYKSCISDKGGCGVNFENCLDADLLGRRANACENVLDQCMAVRSLVLADWDIEAEGVLANATKYADKYARQTCMARIQDCLEQGCSTETNSACLTDVSVAASICPVINECEQMIPGIKTAVNSKLAYLGTQFCQNDVDKCLRNKCGENFNAPECIGKKANDIVAMCPQSMFPSCAKESQFDIIVQAALLQMDYQLLQGCVNYFSEELGRVCGTDMSCLPGDSTIESLTKLPESEDEIYALRQTVQANAANAVDEFFKQFENNKTVAACNDSQKPAGRKGLGDNVFSSAKMIANVSAENRALRALETKIMELARNKDIDTARETCLLTYKVETPDTTSKNYSYVKSVAFESSLRNCHVCRVQQVCEVGGESKGSSALKAAGGSAAGFGAAGTMISPGWGTAIGAVVGAVAGGIMGYQSGGKEEFCQEIESCEDINM